MKRTNRQNRALHVYFQELSNSLNAAGLDMRTVLKPGVQIPWNEKTIKSHLWKPIQKAMLEKESTTELDSAEISKVYEVLNRHLGEMFGFSIPFPSDEAPMLKDLTRG